MASEENPVVKAALDLLPMYGIECWRNQSYHVPGRRFNGRRGVSDVLGITRGGRFVAVECKAPGGMTSKDQEDFLEMIRSKGGVALVASSVSDLERNIARFHREGYF